NPEALRYYFASLKIMEELNDEKSIANTNNNIGRVYYLQGNHAEALKLFMTSLAIYQKLGIKKGIAFCYNNMGLVYYAQGKYNESLKSNFASLKIREDLGDKLGVATSYSSIGIVYFDQAEMEKNEGMRSAKFKEALKSYLSSLEMYEVLGDKAGIAATKSSIGNVFAITGKYNEAEKYLQQAMELSKSIGYKECIRDTYNGFAKVQSARGDFKDAFENHKLYILYRDSLDNEDTRKKTVQSQMTYDFEKKEAIADAEHKKELENQQALADEKSRKQKVVLILVISFLLIVVAFSGFIFRSLRITRKQKNIIELQKKVVEKQKHEVEQQKNIVEQHQKEIIDSITYARRIQRSLLPTHAYIDKTMKRLLSDKKSS
ncbi:MAG: tetratricopeptide repeat protein, partial [Bacteroidetes bacterium]|nr:tetratricopeptide repeat protein [Bacteroidota bacterium]